MFSGNQPFVCGKGIPEIPSYQAFNKKNKKAESFDTHGLYLKRNDFQLKTASYSIGL